MMEKKTNNAILLTIVCLLLISRTTSAKDHSETISAVNKKLDGLIQQKANKNKVDMLLAREGYKLEYNQVKNSIYATKLYSEGLFVSRKHILLIQLNQALVITTYESTQGLIGT